jgi:hypothetical protein
MLSTTAMTIIKMIECLPETEQNQVVEVLRSYILDYQEEARWDELINQTQSKLVKAARLARLQIADGLSTPMDESRL